MGGQNETIENAAKPLQTLALVGKTVSFLHPGIRAAAKSFVTRLIRAVATKDYYHTQING